jgi:iron complex outermembrane receptor protein
MMINRLNRFLLAGASPALMLLAATTAVQAQSTATEAIETVISTGIGSSVNGIMRPTTIPKQRSTIDSTYLTTQVAGQTVFESINKAPGFSFTNNDPYGSSGGNVRIHGYDGNHISLTLDGMPLNDTGNYAIYTNQLMDSENIGQVSINQGATDVDSPSAAASGGVVAIRTSRPSDTFAVMLQPSFGSFNYQRYFGRVDSGAFGPFNTLTFASVSMMSNDKFKGPGKIQKRQYNAGLYQDMGDLGFITLGLHWNANRNNNYASVSFYPVGPAFYTGLPGQPGGTGTPARPNVLLDPDTGALTGVGGAPFGNSVGIGLETDYEESCTRVAGGPGAQSDTRCANYFRRQINPSDTGNIRLSSLWRLSDDVTLTVDPSIQYTLANGGSQYTQLNERDPRLIGASGAAGVDLNGDGNFGVETGSPAGRLSDVTGVFGPSNTNTVRYGLNTSLLWNITDEHTIQLAYTLDYGVHKQTGQAAFLAPDGSPQDWFGGYRDINARVLAADGSVFRTRDRKSHAILNQGAFSYEGDFFEGALHASIGARLPFLTRDLNQYCYLQVVANSSGTANAPLNSVSAPGAGFPFCTTQAPTTVNTANNTVTFANMGNGLYVAPASTSITYTRFLPNIGLSYHVTDEIMVYGAWASSLSAPRTDNLYNGGNNGRCAVNGVLTPTNPGCVFSSFNTQVKLETSNNYALGFRYNADLVNLTVDAYNNQFKNRIVSSYDPELGISLDRNIGSVNVNGVDAEFGLFPFEGFSSYTSVSYFHSRVSDTPEARICLNAPACTSVANLVGKEVAESPNWTVGQRFQYKVSGFNIGLGAKYTGRRYATDTNDLRIPSYVLVDADITYDLGELGWERSYIKFNAMNLFNEKYFGSISSQRCFSPTGQSGCTSYPFLNVGYPQTFQVTLRTVF